MGWTEERIAALKSLWEEGLSASQIAARLGGVTRNAVIGKVHRLGLSGRPSPLRADPARPEAKPASVAAPVARRVVPQPNLTVVRTAAQAEARPVEQAKTAAPAPMLVAEMATAPVAVAEAVVPSGKRISLLNITDRMCKWPLGHPGEPDFHFCGDRSLTGQPYCQTHASMAYQHAAPRRDKQRNGAGGSGA
jgi:GcrA cell cycle regulator